MNELAQALAKIILINRVVGCNAAISERDTQKAIKIFEVKNMRILEGYSEKEQKELKSLRGLSYPFNRLIQDEGRLFPELIKKIGSFGTDPSKDRQIFQDVADYINGKAKFPEPKKYYIHFLKDGSRSYLNVDFANDLMINDKSQTPFFKTQFTREEVSDIDPNYEPFMEEVPEDELAE